MGSSRNFLANLSVRTSPMVRVLTGFLVFVAVPLAAALVERRTVPLDDYRSHPASHLWLLVTVVLCLLATSTNARLRHVEAPGWALGLGSLAIVLCRLPEWRLMGALFGMAVALRILSSLLRKGYLRETSLIFSSAGLLFSAVPVADWACGSVLAGLDIGRPVAAVGALLLPTIFQLRGGTLETSADGQYEAFRMGLDKGGGQYLVALVLLAAIVTCVGKVPLKTAVRHAFAFALYAVLASLYVLLAWDVQTELVWFSEALWCGAYLPLSLWLGFQAAIDVEPDMKGAGPTSVAHQVSLFTGAVCLLAGFSVWGPSRIGAGAIVLDEAHGDWETSQIPLDASTYGSLSVYNYRTMREEASRLLGMTVASKELTREDLTRVSVLVLRTPTRPYSERFQKDVAEYVRAGGGLWMIGDHTDAFGMTTYLNEVGSRLGFTFNKNAFFEPPYKRNLWSPTEFDDATVAGLPTFLFYTGASLNVPWDASRTMVGRRLVVEDADYAAGSFFGPLRTIPSNAAGSFVMSAQGQVGRGRVAIWSDSTLFSNFAILTPGKMEVLANTLEWLRRDSSLPWLRTLLMAVGAVLFLVGVRRSSFQIAYLAIVSAVATTPLMKRADAGWSKVWRPAELRRDPSVCFFEPYKTAHLPMYFSIDEARPEHYWSSFVAAQRLGGYPFWSDSVSDLNSVREIVMIPSGKPLKKTHLTALRQAVLRGATLMVLDGGRDGGGMIRSVVTSFGMGEPFRGEEQATSDVLDAGGRPLGSDTVIPFREDGKVLLKTKPSGSLAAKELRFGAGRLVITSTRTLFSDESVGDVHHVPDRLQIAKLHFLHQLYLSGWGHVPRN